MIINTLFYLCFNIEDGIWITKDIKDNYLISYRINEHEMLIFKDCDEYNKLTELLSLNDDDKVEEFIVR